MKYLKLSKKLMKKYSFTISKIISNTDHTMEDMISESYIITKMYYNDIIKDERVYTNKIRQKCLKFNKYNRRIESLDRWNEFNTLEESMLLRGENNPLNIDEDKLCYLTSIKELLSAEDYNFLITYYSNGGEYTSELYGLKQGSIRSKVSRLISFLKLNL